MTKMDLQIPDGLTDLLQDFTVAVLRRKPSDLLQFAAEYFEHAHRNRQSAPPPPPPAVNNAAVNNAAVNNAAVNNAAVVSDNGATDDEDIIDEEEEAEMLKKRFNRRKSVSAERYDPEADDDDDDPKIIHPKSDVQRANLSKAIADIFILRSIDVEQKQNIIDAMFEKKVKPKEKVIVQGMDGDNFYVIESGEYDASVKIEGKEKVVRNYKGQGSFGELALMYNQPRAATITAKTPGIVWALDRATFRRIILKTAFQKRKMYENLLDSVPMLQSLEVNERMNVADALIPKKYSHKEFIIKQGDSADCMYFIEEGNVKIIQKQENGMEAEVASLGKKNYFGELALLTHKPRAASAYAVGDVKVAVLEIHAFERLLGPCMDIMRRNMNNYEKVTAQVFGKD